MRAGVITGRGRLDWREVPEPAAAADGVVVDVAYCGICGTDVHAFAHGGPYPATLCGHEWAGTVSAVGREVRGVREGDRVCVAILPPCGRCAECRAGLTDWCTTALASLTADPAGSPHGAYAPRVAVSAARVVPVPDALADDVAALVEPATVAYHGVRRAGIALGDTVVVQGAGPIGAFALQWARLAGAGRVVVVEPSPERRALAARLGADAVVAPGDEAATLVRDGTDGRGADVVVECAGVPATVQTAIDLARRGGAVMLIGLSDLPATVQPGAWLAKEVTVRASIAYVRTEFAHSIALLADGRVQAAAVHTSTVDLDALPDALARLAAGAPAETKVLVDPR